MLRRSIRGSRVSLVFAVSLVLVASFSLFAWAQEKPDTEGLTLVSQGKAYTYTSSRGPSSRYPDPDLNKLTNGASGAANVRDPEWVGFYAPEPIKVVIDLEQSVAIDRILTHHYAATVGGVAWPGVISVSTSDDGVNWSFPAVYKFSGGYPPDPTTAWFMLNDVGLSGRYVELAFELAETREGGMNLFIGEIEVYTR